MINIKCTLCPQNECKKNISTIMCIEKILETYPYECGEKIKIIEQIKNRKYKYEKRE